MSMKKRIVSVALVLAICLSTAFSSVFAVDVAGSEILIPKRIFKNDNFDHIPAGTDLGHGNSTTEFNATAQNPMWITSWGVSSAPVREIVEEGGSNVYHFHRNPSDGNVVNQLLYDSVSDVDKVTPLSNNLVIDFKFKAVSHTDYNGDNGRFRVELKVTEPSQDPEGQPTTSTVRLMQYVYKKDNTVAGNNTLDFLGEQVPLPSGDWRQIGIKNVAPDEWHRVQMYLDLNDLQNRKIIEACVDGKRADYIDNGLTIRSDRITALKPFSNYSSYQLNLFVGDGTIDIYFDDVMLYDPTGITATTIALTDGNDAELVGPLTAGQTVKAAVGLTNTTAADVNALLILAAYKDGKMVTCKVQPVTSVKNTANVTNSVTMEVTDDTAGCDWKAFIWDTGLNPLELPAQYPEA